MQDKERKCVLPMPLNEAEFSFRKLTTAVRELTNSMQHSPS